MLESLIVIGMAIHLLAVNLASAGPLVCIWLHFRSRDDTLRDQLGKSLAWSSLAALVVGIVSGGILVLVAPSEGIYEAIGRLPARAYWMAGTELVFSLVFLLIYAVCWKPLCRWRVLHALISLLGTSNLLYHFPPLMIVLGKLASTPTWSKEAIIERPDFVKLMARGEVVSLTLHFCLASIAVAGVAALVLLARTAVEDSQQSSAKKIARGSAVFALVASLLQLPIGVWVLVTLSGAERNTLTGGAPVASLMFVGGMLLTFVLLQRLVAVAMGDVEPGVLRRVGWLLVVLVLMMTATLRGARVKSLPSNPPAKNASANKTAAEDTPPRLVLTNHDVFKQPVM